MNLDFLSTVAWSHITLGDLHDFWHISQLIECCQRKMDINTGQSYWVLGPLLSTQLALSLDLYYGIITHLSFGEQWSVPYF
jgi:hypothetical protein